MFSPLICCPGSDLPYFWALVMLTIFTSSLRMISKPSTLVESWHFLTVTYLIFGLGYSGSESASALFLATVEHLVEDLSPGPWNKTVRCQLWQSWGNVLVGVILKGKKQEDFLLACKGKIKQLNFRDESGFRYHLIPSNLFTYWLKKIIQESWNFCQNLYSY